jgi:hypothetical protein
MASSSVNSCRKTRTVRTPREDRRGSGYKGWIRYMTGFICIDQHVDDGTACTVRPPGGGAFHLDPAQRIHYLQVFGHDLQCQPVRSDNPKGMPLATRKAALQAEQRHEPPWHPSSPNSSRKTRTAPQTHPDCANPNKTEYMVQNAHRTTAL